MDPVQTPTSTPAPAAPVVVAPTAEQMKQLRDELAPAIAAQIVVQSKGNRDGEMAALFGSKSGPGSEEPRRVITGKSAADGTGINLARAIKARFVEKLTGKSAVDVLKGWGYHDVANVVSDAIGAQRAASASSNTYESMGLFVQTQMAQEMFELLRPKVWIRNRAREVPLIGGLQFKRQTSTSTSAYAGESTPISQSAAPKFGEDAMSEKKLTTLVSFPNRLLQIASVAAEEFVRNDVIASKARKENLSFYRGTGTLGAPKGIRTRALAAHVFTADQAGATATLAEVRDTKSALLLKLEEADAPMQALAWIMSPRVKHFLANISDGNGNAVYEAQIAAGTWGGIPFDCSTQVPNDLTDGAETDLSELGLVDYSEVIIGQGDTFYEVFPNAAYEADGSVKSGINRDESVVRLIDYHDLITRHDESTAFARVAWGA